jgi:MOSC domain-containing protein
VYDAAGCIVPARKHPALLAHRGSLGPDGAPRVDGWPWSSPEAAAVIARAAGAAARLERFTGEERLDVLPLLIATDGAIAALGVDGRRLRIGAVIVAVVELRERCVMTTYDPDTQAQDSRVLRRIVREFGGTMALDCAVEICSAVHVGDPVVLL